MYYQIYADKKLVYDSGMQDNTIVKGTLSLDVESAGKLEFSLLQSHPFYDSLEDLKTTIVCLRNGELVFKGRVLYHTDNFFNTRSFVCEGEKAYLNDSVMRPYEFTGSPTLFFTQLIQNHNSQVDDFKRFTIGEVTVQDKNDYINRSDTIINKTLKVFEDKLQDALGGYLYFTHDENWNTTVNWIEDYEFLAKQNIEFGQNLVDFTKEINSEDVFTVLVPLGAKTSEEEGAPRLTIEEVNGGKDYVYSQEGVEKYGYIWATQTWDDVGTAQNLLTKANAYLAENIKQTITIELTAVDLSMIDKTIDMFRIGDYIRITSKPHNMDDLMLLKSMELNLLNPSADTIVLGYSVSSFIKETNKNNQNTLNIIRNEVTEGNYKINEYIESQIENLKSLINQTSSEITLMVSQQYVTNDKLTSEISTTFTQLSNSFEFQFNELQTYVDAAQESNRQEFTEIKKYIRFENGNIILGESGNELTLQIQNDRISFLESGSEVAYFSNRKLYVTDGQFLNSLQLGNFAFIPRNNGNLSFKKIINN